jgi:FAD:protein FMN transferase
MARSTNGKGAARAISRRVPGPPTHRIVPHGAVRHAQASWQALGTNVALRVTDPRAMARAREAVVRELEAVDCACSRFRSDSEITSVNERAGGRPARVSDLLAQAIGLALRAAQLTGGDVDPTVGRALVLSGYDRDWHEMRERAAGYTSEETAPAKVAIKRVGGWRSVRFDPEARTVRVPLGVMLDLGATAKAWVADRAARAATEAGGCGALVSVGGDIAVSGQAPAGGWPVHVTDDHESAPSAPGQTVKIESGGLATSSTTVRRWRYNEQTMHHIIDPATGAPVRGTWRTVSVAAASCADANIASTAALVRAGAAPAWLARAGMPARLVSANGRVYTIGDWPAQAARGPVELEPAAQGPAEQGTTARGPAAQEPIAQEPAKQEPTR